MKSSLESSSCATIFFPKEQLFIGMHQRTLPDRGAGLHQGNAGWTLVFIKPRFAMPEAIAPELTIRNRAAEIELVDQRAQLFGVDPATGGDQAGSDFDDQAHE